MPIVSRNILLALTLGFGLGNASAETILVNAGFEAGMNDGVPPNWEFAIQDGYSVTVDTSEAIEGTSSLHMTPMDEPAAVMVRQSLDPSRLEGTRLTFTGAIKTRALDGQAALFVMAEGNGERLFMDDMRERAVSGDSDWAYFRIATPPLPAADQFHVGLLVLGDGEVWFDDFQVEVSSISREISEEAWSYLDEALDLMQERSFVRDRIDWQAFREKVKKSAAGAESAEDTHGAIRYALQLLGDNHSGFLPAGEVDTPDSTKPSGQSAPPFRARLLEGELGYLEISGFRGNGSAAGEYATALQEAIRDLEEEGACAWIVDLRENTGGNMWPMIAGLGPLLRNETVGYFSAPGEESARWWYREGQAGIGETTKVTVEGFHQLSDPSALVAILIGNQTASSGEAVALAFTRREGTQRFGEATTGLTTANASISLSDGSHLNLAIAAMEDRGGKRYPDGIPPDVEISPDRALGMASRRLSRHRSCDQ